MELDVELTREGDQPWGFRLIGGTDFKVPLTIVKVLPDSPAEKAGLQNGDTVARIGDKVADDLSHDDARLIVDGAKMTLKLGVKRGLYDPVLDNYEPLYEDIDQIEQADIDQPLQPTEVHDSFQIQKFLDPNQDIFPPNDLAVSTKLSESRSLTASPFLLPTKPYRPFSTEPLPQIPPLEDPIILNPNYNDEFGKILDDIDDLQGLINYESRFKLPISKQYDPNWDKNETERLEKDKKGIQVTLSKIETKNVTQECIKKTEMQNVISEKEEQIAIEDVSMKKMTQEIDLDKIEFTATSIVDESIEKAKTVAEEIKKEIDIELSEVTSLDLFESKTVKNSRISSEIKSESLETSQVSIEKIEKQSEHEDLGIVKREIHLVKESKEIYESSDDAKSKTEVKMAKKVEQYEAVDGEDHITYERKKPIQKEVEEVIENGTVRRKSKMFDKEETIVDSKVKSDVDVRQAKSDINNKNIDTNDQKTLTTGGESENKTTDAQAEHRAYKIGLKTIPNIRGTVHSSYHYNLLLQTFFLHLTDVMVALSRFILSEPVFNKVEEKRESVATQQMRTSAFETKTETVSKRKENSVKVSESKSVEKRVNTVESSLVQKDNAIVQEKKLLKEVNEEKKETKAAEQFVQKTEEAKQIENVEQITVSKNEAKDNTARIKTHKKAVSGSEMAQLSEKKTEELTVKMDAVISEFENKTGIEETSEHRKRSRSRSQVVEEVTKESDPIVCLSKVDNKETQEITKSKTSSNEFSSKVESTEMKKEMSSIFKSAAEKIVESRRGSRARSTTPNEGKQMYVAIVESHVYTNKDTVLFDQTDESETSSFVEKTNTAMESVETTATENVAKERSEIVKQTASMIGDKRHDDVSVVIAKQEEVIKAEKELHTESKQLEKKIKEVVQNSNELLSEQVKIKTIQNDIKTQEKAVQKVKEPIIEVHENKQLENKIEEVVQKSNEIVAEQIKVETTQSKVKTQDIVVQQMSEPIVELYESKDIDISEKSQEVTVEKERFEIAKKETVEIQEISSMSESLAIEEERESHGYVEMAKEKLAVVKEDQSLELNVSADIKVDKVDIKQIKPQLESAALKIVKEQVIEVQPSPEILEKEETKVLKIEKAVDMSKGSVVESESQFVDISSSSSSDSIDMRSKTAIQQSTFTAKQSVKQSESSFAATSYSNSVQESSFTARSKESNGQKLTLRTDIAQKTIFKQQSSVSSDENNNIDTPSPSTVSPTPVTDEYVFKLQIPLPKTSGKVIPLDLTPEEEEDLHIVKKKLVPHIEATLESPVIYDPPLPSPPGSKLGSPVYTKPGLRGGNINYLRKEEILEIERKSTLLASAIDETIKSIEEYKEQVGMDTKREVSENYSKEESKVFTELKTEVKSNIVDDWSKVDKQINDNKEDKIELKSVLLNGDIERNVNKLDTLENKYASEEIMFENEISKNVTHNLEFVREQDKSIESGRCAEESVRSMELSNCDNDVEKCLTNGENKVINTVTDVGSIFGKGENLEVVEEKEDPMKGFRPVVFNPEAKNPRPTGVYIVLPPQETGRPYTTPTGELLGTHQGIVDGLEEATVDEEVAKELGKPGMTEEKIAELISGESEMLREAHVMGLTRVITSHMSRADDNSSVDFNKIKPIVESLRDSEVLKALNEELLKKCKEEKKKDEKKWTTFLQRPKRAVPKAKFGYHAYVDQEEPVIEAPYKVKIVKQPKPKVAPDYKPKNFDTGPLPWEERALNEPPPPPVEAEDPILVPEEEPEFLEAVDPLPESEVPDLEDTGIPLPPPKTEEEPAQPAPEPVEEEPELPSEEPEQPEPVEENKEEMENRLAEQLVSSVQNMVDPNASLEQQLNQMRAQLAALAQLPAVIQQTLEMVSSQLSQITQQETHRSQQLVSEQTQHCTVEEVTENHESTISEETGEDVQREQNGVTEVTDAQTVDQNVAAQPSLTQEEMDKLRKEEEEMLEEQRRIEKQKKEMMEQMRQDQESRQVKQRPTPRVGKPKPVFGNGDHERPLVLPGGRKWRGPKDVFNDQFIAETLSAQAEIIQGKAMGMSFESDLLPYDERINFLKYEKPPVSLDHLQHSDVYKLVHGMEQTPPRRVDMLTPVVAEADYREKCRSVTPCVGRMAQEQHQDFPQQVQP